MVRIDTSEAANDLSRCINLVAQGTQVVICRESQPVAELHALAPFPTPRVAGLLKGQIHFEPDAFAPLNDHRIWPGELIAPEKPNPVCHNARISS